MAPAIRGHFLLGPGATGLGPNPMYRRGGWPRSRAVENPISRKGDTPRQAQGKLGRTLLQFVLSIIDNPCHECYFCLMPINVNLTPELEGLIRQKVSSGRYNSASEVVREALRLMETEDQLRAAKLAQLRHDIQEGPESGPARPWSVAEMKREGRKRLATRTASSRK
jgi:antitoxin ParD1/3/4